MIEELKQIEIMIRARYPIIYIVSSEEIRVLENLQEILRDEQDLHVWSFSRGFRKFVNSDDVHDMTSDPISALNYISESQKNGLYVLTDFHMFLNAQNPQILRMLRELNEELKKSKKNIIIISPVLTIPIELDKDISVIDFPLPNQEEIRHLFNKIYKSVSDQDKLDTEIKEENKEQIIKALMGLTQNEIENVIYKSLVEKHSFDIAVIIKEKEQIIRKTGILEYFHSEETIKHIGGLLNLKEWIIKRKNAFMDTAREFGVPYPKGLLLLGIQGCGKSLCCKVIANLWTFPLLRLDIGVIFQGIVGSSESNIRNAIKLAESISPCVLWIDEIEKGFSGVKSSDQSDAGTTARVFSTFLTWMQEKVKPVFVVATANDISTLPPELLRKGRFDDIFFIDLPNRKERSEIFKIHLQKKNRDPSKFDIEKLVDKTNKFSGAEIESVIISALYDAFEDNLKDNKKDLETRHILNNLNQVIPLAITLEEKIINMRNWANKRARPATSPESSKKERVLDL